MQTRNNTEKNKKDERKFIRFFIPAFLALLIHLSFFGFKKAESDADPNIEKPKRVMLLPRNTVIFEEQKLLAWMEMLDPSYFIQPNRKYGFSRTFNAVKMKDMPVKFDKNENFVQINKKPKDFLPEPWRPRIERIKEEWEYKIAGVPPIDISTFKKNLEYPVWMSEKSDVLPQLFSDIDSLQDTIKTTPPKSQETVLKADFFGPNFFPKVEIIHSCGIPALDKLAMRTLTVKGKILAINDKETNESKYISVKWYSKK